MLVGVAVLDRAEVKLALVGAVFGDVGQPLHVRRSGGEVAAAAGDLEQVVVHRRAGLAVQAAFLRVQRPDPLRRAQPLDPVLSGA